PCAGRCGDLSLVALLPALRRRLGLPAELHVVKAPARECSGLVLLSGCHRATERLQQSFSRARRGGRFPATYCAVTVGVPAEPEGEIRAALRWQQQGDTAVVVPVPAPGRRSLARKEVKNTLTRYRVLGAAGGCALLQLQPKTGERHPDISPVSPCCQHGPTSPRVSPAFPEQLPVHLTLLLCPALGDHEHSSRVGRVLGVPFLLPPEAAPTRAQVRGGAGGLAAAPRAPPDPPSSSQVLDEELVARLGLSPQQLRRLPLHLHLQRLELP
ncbi:RUSD3 synthase, partial [Centropus unirufus]|nr:RUSD3 synthase [Centropus unirufus]